MQQQEIKTQPLINADLNQYPPTGFYDEYNLNKRTITYGVNKTLDTL